MNRPKLKACSERDLVLFHYGELDAMQQRSLREHLETCSACRAELAAMQRALGSLPTPEVVLNEVEKRRMSVVIADRATRPLRPRRWAWGTALAAASVLALSLWIIPRGAGPLPGTVLQSESELGMLQDMELLQNLDLLENLDLLQELESNA